MDLHTSLSILATNREAVLSLSVAISKPSGPPFLSLSLSLSLMLACRGASAG